MTDTDDPDQASNLLECLKECKLNYGAWSSQSKHRNRLCSYNFPHFGEKEERNDEQSRSKRTTAPWHSRESKPARPKVKEPVPEPTGTPPQELVPLSAKDHKRRRPLQDLGTSTGSIPWRLTEYQPENWPGYAQLPGTSKKLLLSSGSIWTPQAPGQGSVIALQTTLVLESIRTSGQGKSRSTSVQHFAYA